MAAAREERAAIKDTANISRKFRRIIILVFFDVVYISGLLRCWGNKNVWPYSHASHPLSRFGPHRNGYKTSARIYMLRILSLLWGFCFSLVFPIVLNWIKTYNKLKVAILFFSECKFTTNGLIKSRLLLRQPSRQCEIFILFVQMICWLWNN